MSIVRVIVLETLRLVQKRSENRDRNGIVCPIMSPLPPSFCAVCIVWRAVWPSPTMLSYRASHHACIFYVEWMRAHRHSISCESLSIPTTIRFDLRVNMYDVHSHSEKLLSRGTTRYLILMVHTITMTMTLAQWRILWEPERQDCSRGVCRLQGAVFGMKAQATHRHISYLIPVK